MPTPPTTELGHVANTGWGGRSTFGWPIDEAEESAAWQWPMSIATADRMSRHPQVQAVWWALTLPMRRDIWAIDPQEADPARVDMLADDLDLPILDERGERRRRPKPRRKGRFSWPEHLRLALLHLRWGCMFFEPVYDAVALEQSGQARLRKLAPRFPRTLSHIDVEADGGLKAIRQWTAGPGAKEITIPVDRLVAYVHNREGANWHGQSIFRAMYRPFDLADRSERVEAMTGERNGMGIPTAEVIPGYTGQITQDMIDRASEVAQAWRAGDYSGAALPPGFRMRLVGVDGTLPDLDKPITRHYGLMAKSVQAMFMELGTTAAGHRALGETFVDFFAAAVGGISDAIADVATQHVVEDWWDLNFGPDDPAPAVVSAPIDAETDIPPESLVALVNAKVITPDADIEAWLRTRYRLPAQAAPTGNLAFLAPVAAHRRPVRARSVAAARPGWEDRLAEAMAAVVDTEAIAAAVAEGTPAADAVAAGLAADLTPLEDVLADLWAEGWEAGVARAVARVPAAASRQVRASLSDLLANVRALTASVVGSLRDRLTSAVAAAQPGDELREMLEGLASDHSAAGRIVVTETQRAMVAAATETWRGAGVSSFRWVRASGESDDCGFECDDRAGTEGDWDDLPPLHPNCSCEVEPASG